MPQRKLSASQLKRLAISESAVLSLGRSALVAQRRRHSLRQTLPGNAAAGAAAVVPLPAQLQRIYDPGGQEVRAVPRRLEGAPPNLPLPPMESGRARPAVTC